MFKSIITFRLHGGMRLLREAKSLSNQDIQSAIKNAQNDSAFGKVFVYLPSNTKNHDVILEQHPCFQEIKVNSTQFKAIMNGSARPSDGFCLNHKLMVKTKSGKVFLVKKWQELSEQERLHMFYSEIALDKQAEISTIKIL